MEEMRNILDEVSVINRLSLQKPAGLARLTLNCVGMRKGWMDADV